MRRRTPHAGVSASARRGRSNRTLGRPHRAWSGRRTRSARLNPFPCGTRCPYPWGGWCPRGSWNRGRRGTLGDSRWRTWHRSRLSFLGVVPPGDCDHHNNEDDQQHRGGRASLLFLCHFLYPPGKVLPSPDTILTGFIAKARGVFPVERCFLQGSGSSCCYSRYFSGGPKNLS